MWQLMVSIRGGNEYLHPDKWSVDFNNPQITIDQLCDKQKWLRGKLHKLNGDFLIATREYIEWIDKRLQFIEQVLNG